jgi:hypothetical protein
MNLTVQETYEYNLCSEAGGTVILGNFLCFADGRGVAFLLEDNLELCWLLEMGTARGTVKRAIAPEIRDELKNYVRGDDDKLAYLPDSFLAFKCGERVGLLARDKKIYLFDDIAGEPMVIDIANDVPQVTPMFNAQYKVSYTVVACGNSATTAIPVIFGHPDDRGDYPGFMALLDIDIDGRTASWRVHDGKLPQPVIISHKRHGADERGLRGSIIHDAAWTGEKLLIFTIGATSLYFRGGMSYSILLETDVNAGSPRQLYDCDENVFGMFCASLDKVILTPLYQSGTRKGKQSLYDMQKSAEESINLPRGHAKFTVLDVGEQFAWLAPRSNPGTYFENDPVKFVRCAVQQS